MQMFVVLRQHILWFAKLLRSTLCVLFCGRRRRAFNWLAPREGKIPIIWQHPPCNRNNIHIVARLVRDKATIFVTQKRTQNSHDYLYIWIYNWGKVEHTYHFCFNLIFPYLFVCLLFPHFLWTRFVWVLCWLLARVECFNLVLSVFECVGGRYTTRLELSFN